MIIRKLNEPSVKYKKLQGNDKELTRNYMSLKKDIEKNQQGQKRNE